MYVCAVCSFPLWGFDISSLDGEINTFFLGFNPQFFFEHRGCSFHNFVMFSSLQSGLVSNRGHDLPWRRIRLQTILQRRWRTGTGFWLPAGQRRRQYLLLWFWVLTLLLQRLICGYLRQIWREELLHGVDIQVRVFSQVFFSLLKKKTRPSGRKKQHCMIWGPRVGNTRTNMSSKKIGWNVQGHGLCVSTPSLISLACLVINCLHGHQDVSLTMCVEERKLSQFFHSCVSSLVQLGDGTWNAWLCDSAPDDIRVLLSVPGSQIKQFLRPCGNRAH